MKRQFSRMSLGLAGFFLVIILGGYAASVNAQVENPQAGSVEVNATRPAADAPGTEEPGTDTITPVPETPAADEGSGESPGGTTSPEGQQPPGATEEGSPLGIFEIVTYGLAITTGVSAGAYWIGTKAGFSFLKFRKPSDIL